MNYPKPLRDLYTSLGMTAAALEQVLSLYQPITIPKGTHLVRRGEPSNHYLFVTNGLLRAYVLDPEGRDITTQFYPPDTFAMEMSAFLLQQPALENIITLVEVRGWKVEYEAFQSVFNEQEAFRNWGRSWLVQALIQQKQQMLSRITDTARDRYLKVRLQQPEILRHAPLKHLATYLGMTDSSLSRIRKELSQSDFLP